MQPDQEQNITQAASRSEAPIDQPAEHARIPDKCMSADTLEQLQNYESIRHKINSAIANQNDVVVLFTDIDGTFTPAVGSRTEAVVAMQEAAMAEFADLVRDRNYILIPITGSSYEVSTRTLQSLSQRIADGEIPEIFDGLIVEGGTRAVLKLRSYPEFQYDTAYAERVALEVQSFKDNLSTHMKIADALIDAICQADAAGPFSFITTPTETARRLIQDIEGKDWTAELRLEKQPHAHPEPHTAPLDRISLYLYASNLTERDTIEKAFMDAFPDLNVVCCEERDFNSAAQKTLAGEPAIKKYCLDITPINKATPIALLSEAIASATEAQNQLLGGTAKVVSVYFGDAGNDLPAARSESIKRMCIVGAASPELVRAANELTASKEAVYVESDPNRIGVASMLAALRDWNLA